MSINGHLQLSTFQISTLPLDIGKNQEYKRLSQKNIYKIFIFRPENTVFTGLEITENRIFVAFPRLYSGIPATLGTIPRHTPPGSSPNIQPYPNWNFHGIDRSNDTCDELISVYRIRQDSCNRLWVNKSPPYLYNY